MKKKRYNRLIENFSYLSILEIIKLLFPFLTLPYLIATLGKELYGLVAFAQAFAAYFAIFINLGLDISAVKDISIERDNKIKIDEIVSSVLIIKFLLLVVSFLIILSLVFFFPFFKKHSLLYIFSLGYCLIEVVIPVWYYQGIEKMKYITIIRFISTLIFTIAVFVVVKKESDYLYIPILQGAGAFVGGLLSFHILINREKIRFHIPKFSILLKYVKASFPFFLSRISAIINTTLAKIISGVFLGMGQVAILDLVDKLVNVAKIPFNTINAVVYPHIARTRARLFVKKVFLITISMAVVISLLVVFFSPFLIKIFSGNTMPEAIPLLQLSSFNIILCSITYYLGVPVLVSFGLQRPFNYSVILSTMFLTLLYFLLYLLDAFSLSAFIYCTILSEFMVLIYRGFYSYKLFRIR